MTIDFPNKMDISSNCMETLGIIRQEGREGRARDHGHLCCSKMSALNVPKGTECNVKTDGVLRHFPKLGQFSEQKFLAW